MNQNANGRWEPGRSGNPRGRPRGTGDVARLRAAISSRLPELIDRLIQSALDGDSQAARLLLERTVPALRPIDAPTRIDLPSEGVSAKAKAIIAHATSGGVSVMEAAQLVSALTSVAKLVELEELTQRVARLEQVT